MLGTALVAGTALAAAALLAACGSTPLRAGGGGASPAATGGRPAASASATTPAVAASGSPVAAGGHCPRLPVPAAGPRSLSGIQFVSPDRGWVVGQRQILGTSDGGRHWSVQDSGSLNLTSVDFISSQTGWAVGTGTLLTTADGGAHWTALPDPCLRSVHFVSADLGFAVAGGRPGPEPVDQAPASGGRTLVTTDGGRTWRSLRAPAGAQTVCFDDSEHGWLGAAGKLYRTADGGHTWSLVTAGARPPAAGSVATMVVQCAGAGTAWAVDIGPGAGMSQEPHVGYYASSAGAVPLFAEQYFPHQGVTVRTQSPGSYAGPVSAISPTSAAFLDWCAACGAGTVPWDLVSGTTVTKEGSVGGLTQAQSASFLSSQLGWVAGTMTRFQGSASREYERIVGTTDGGRSWRVLYTS